MTDIDHLRDLYSRLGGPAEFVEPQEEPRGTVRSETELERDIEVLVSEMRDRFDFRTTLTDRDLATVVSGFYDGQSDREVAADLEVSWETVFRARMLLQLFDDADVAGVDVDEAAHLLREGLSTAAVAERLGTSKAAIDRTERFLAARELARRLNYRYPTEFEDLLADVAVDIDRHVWNDRRALVDAHED